MIVPERFFVEPIHLTPASRAWTLHCPVKLHDPSRRFNLTWECRNVDLLSIDYAFRPRLRSRLTLGGFTFPRKPWAFGDGDSHSVYRYSSRHIHFLPLHSASRRRFAADRNAPLPPRHKPGARSFGTVLIPDHFWRWIPRPVSCYALFKWWLLLSQHPGCHGNPTTFETENCSGALTGGLGSFPFDHGNYLPRTDSHGRAARYSEFG